MSFYLSRFTTNNNIIEAGAPVYLVAEIGLNHNNDLPLAKKMILAARDAGANAVKFQSYTVDKFINKSVEKVKGLYEIFAKYELTLAAHEQLAEFCAAEKIDFFSTPLTLDWPAKLSDLEVPFLKIASGDLNNYALLLEAMKQDKPLIVSTGASSFADIEATELFFQQRSFSKVIFLHCISLYPTQSHEAKLETISKLKKMSPGLLVGFSDHTAGAEAAFAAACLGAVVIEKHFTLDKKLEGPDHAISADPVELAEIRSKVDLARELRGEAREAALEKEVAGDFFGKRSLYEIEGGLVPMRPRQSSLPKDSDYLDLVK